MAKSGVDISTHNGTIDFAKLAKEVEFVMIRGGYSTTVDEKFIANVEGCIKNNIPFGVYWFSYALSVEEAFNEATFCYNTINKYNPKYPIAFDWEYDSDAYFERKMGRKATNKERVAIADTFCMAIEKLGYKPMLYTNVDYMDNKGFLALAKKYPIWLAHWGVKTPAYSCKMWQYSSTGRINGIGGNVDLDKSYFDDDETAGNKVDIAVKNLDSVFKKYNNDYVNIAKDIIKGKYGNGSERKSRLKALGYDYEFAQAIVNAIL